MLLSTIFQLYGGTSQRSSLESLQKHHYTNYAISAYHHKHCGFKSRLGEVFSIQRYVIKVCQLLAAGQWFSLRTLVSPTNKIDRHDITEILLKLSLNIVRFELTTLVVICIDCIGSCRSNYNMITTIDLKKAVNYQMPSFFLCPKGDLWIQFWLYCQTCMKRSSLGQRKSGLIRQVTSYKRFNS